MELESDNSSVLGDKDKVVITEPKVDEKKHIPTYAEVFKDIDEREAIDTFKENQGISKLNQDSQALLSEANEFIKKHNITLPQRDLTAQEQDELDKFQQQISDIQDKMQELNDETI
jgi:hypothetical protein